MMKMNEVGFIDDDQIMKREKSHSEKKEEEEEEKLNKADSVGVFGC
jgi:hypothetical protein